MRQLSKIKYRTYQTPVTGLTRFQNLNSSLCCQV